MKFKICPTCKTHNPPSEDYCIKCGVSIENVRATDEETEKAKQEETNNDNKPVMVRICENCGHANPLYLGACENCNDDLTGITPQPQASPEAQSAQYRVTLISLDELMAYELQPGDTLGGRKGIMADYLKPKMYVSREPAIFSLNEGKLFEEATECPLVAGLISRQGRATGEDWEAGAVAMET